MKIGRLIVYLLFMGVLFSFLGNCATDKTAYVAKADEEIYGIWVNVEESPQKIVMYPDGTWETYTYASDTFPESWGIYELYKKWEDDQGNIWYHNYNTYEGYAGSKKHSLELDRIYRKGKEWVWEYEYESVVEFDPGNFLTKINSEGVRYHIFYRSAE